MFPLSESPDPILLEAVATDLGVDPSFVEKDWHAIRVIAAVANVGFDALQPVFSGGTSLSKGYGLIQRFSEDLDFKVLLPDAGIGRDIRRKYRAAVIDAIRSDEAWTLCDKDVLARNESRFFRCEIEYSPNFVPAEPVRTRIRLEMTLKPPALLPEKRPLQSFVSQARRQPPEIERIACVAPAETAADKISALTWRILSRLPGNKADDNNLVRHIHDLAALEGHAAKHPGFPELLKKRIDDDAMRMNAVPETTGMSSVERVSTVLNLLTTDPEYRSQYRRFVDAMCYGREDETPKFDRAVDAVRRLGYLLN